MFEGRVLVGRYKLLSKLGSGGMGSVWRARDLTLNADVAVKLIEPQHASSQEALTRFRREAQAAAAIRSTYVVQIIDYGIDRDEPFIAMELLVGDSLAQRLARVGKLSPEATGNVFGHVGRALSLAHEREIVHRDLKPDNVFLVREGDEDVGKVLDFGIARALSLGESGGGVATLTGTVLGSPYYMSPEQASGQPLDALSDIWSFGVMACECLAGQRPFRGETLAHLFHAICMAPLPVPSSLAAVPRGFDAWFARAVAREKGERYPSIRQAAEDLKAICLARPASVGAGTGQLGMSRLAQGAEAGAATQTLTSVHFDAASQSATVASKRPSSARTAALLVGGLVIVALAVALAWLWGGAPTAATAAATGREPSPGPQTAVTGSPAPHALAAATPPVGAPPAASAAASAAVSSASSVATAAASVASSSTSSAKPPRAPAPPRLDAKPKPQDNAAGI